MIDVLFLFPRPKNIKAMVLNVEFIDPQGYAE